MKSRKCVECGFVGWADGLNCKACGAPMTQQHSYSLPPPTPVSNVNYNQWNEPESPKSGLSIFALVLGIINFCTLGLLGVGAIVGSIVGWVAMTRAKREPRLYGGHGLAIAGFVMSIVSLVSIVPIAIIAAIAIPNLLASRRAANEGSAIYSLRQVAAAEATYQAKFGKYATLDELAEQKLIDPRIATGSRNGYNFAVELTTDDEEFGGFAVTGVPITYRNTGNRSFYIDETQVIRAADNAGAPPTKYDQPLGAESDYRRRVDYQPQTVY